MAFVSIIMRLFEAKETKNSSPFGYKAGQSVQLKSGGPKMTVDGIAYNGYIQCTWFDDNELKSARLAPASLSPVASGAKDKPSKSHKNLAPSGSRRQQAHR